MPVCLIDVQWEPFKALTLGQIETQNIRGNDNNRQMNYSEKINLRPDKQGKFDHII
jgi:hypothetical protein